MNRGWKLLGVVLCLLGLNSQASAQYCVPSCCYTTPCSTICYTPCNTPCYPIWCPPVCWCPPIYCYPLCGTVTGGSIVIVVTGPSGLTDLKVTVDKKDAKPQTDPTIFVSADTVDVTKEAEVTATAKLNGMDYEFKGKFMGNTTDYIELKKK